MGPLFTIMIWLVLESQNKNNSCHFLFQTSHKRGKPQKNATALMYVEDTTLAWICDIQRHGAAAYWASSVQSYL